MRHLIPAAMSILVFSLLASPMLFPASPVATDDHNRVERLTEAEMVDIVGAGWLSHLDCTKIANRTGKVLQVVGFLYRDGFTSGIGNFLRHVTCEF